MNNAYTDSIFKNTSKFQGPPLRIFEGVFLTRDFILGLQHEFRTPLTVLRTGLEMINAKNTQAVKPRCFEDLNSPINHSKI